MVERNAGAAQFIAGAYVQEHDNDGPFAWLAGWVEIDKFDFFDLRIHDDLAQRKQKTQPAPAMS